MKIIIVVLTAVFLTINAYSQQLVTEDINQMVELINVQINLNKFQKTELTKILTASLTEHQRIQKLQLVDVEKLQLIQKNQNNTRSKLEVVLEPEQYKNYIAFLEGGEFVPSGDPILSNNATNTTPISAVNDNQSVNQPLKSTIAIAEKLGFTGTQKTEFVMIYDQQEATLKNILSQGTITEASGVDLLTTVLATDFKIIDLGGKEKYQQYFQMRQSGQLNNNASVPNNQNVDINQVYTFYDIKESIDMNELQAESFIRLFLNNEIAKKNIRQQNKGNAAAINQKIKQLETDTFKKLGQFLSEAQVKKLLQQMGG